MHPAFTDLFESIHSTLAEIKSVEDFAKAQADGKFGALEFWPAVRGTELAGLYDTVRHARETALNANFPESLRQKGVDDLKGAVEKVLDGLKNPPKVEEEEKTETAADGKAPETAAPETKPAEAAAATPPEQPKS